MLVSSGSSGMAAKRWFPKAPRLAASDISELFASVASEAELRFDMGFGQPGAPKVLRPSKADAEFVDFTLLFDVEDWTSLDSARLSALSQILGAILALGLLTREQASTVKHYCKQHGIGWAEVTLDDPPPEKALAEFHPEAREHLEHPLFWDSTNDYGPVGNDTGADVLGLYREWRVEHDSHDRILFFKQLVSHWQLQELGHLSDSDIKVRLAHDAYRLLAWDDAIIGWAVAQIACDGNMNPNTRSLAESAVIRQSIDFVIEHRGWDSPRDRVEALAIVRRVLEHTSLE